MKDYWESRLAERVNYVLLIGGPVVGIWEGFSTGNPPLGLLAGLVAFTVAYYALWLSHKLDTINENRSRHLESPAHVWAAASRLLQRAENGVDVFATASVPSDVQYEQLLIDKIKGKSLHFTRVLCYVEPKDASPPPGDEKWLFSDPVADIHPGHWGDYLLWYTKFYALWTNYTTLGKYAGHWDKCSQHCMVQWKKAMEQLSPNKAYIDVRYYNHGLINDYLIRDDEEAMLAFPTGSGLQYDRGLYVEVPLLVGELRHNFQRLFGGPMPAGKLENSAASEAEGS